MHHTKDTVPRATPVGRDPGPGSALGELGRLNPEWEPWLDLIDLVLKEADDPVWAEAHVELDAERGPSDPLLHNATITVDVRAAHRWTRDLLNAAAPHLLNSSDRRKRLDARDVDALVLMEIAATNDRTGIGTIATELDVDADGLFAVAQLAARPLLMSACGQIEDEVPTSRQAGHCPICGAWPTIAELRGLKKSRHLRCGCCGGDWTLPVLHCPYCNEVDHTKLGGLVVDGEEETRRVETCHSCKGYLKTTTTLVAIPAPRLAIVDLEMIDHEIAALERGFHRPKGPGAAIELQISPLEAGRSRLEIATGLLTRRWRTP